VKGGEIMSNEVEPVFETLVFKLPFLILGIAIGMAVVWVALQWVPAVAGPIFRGIAGG
jgi:hypothetical protein